MTKEFLLFLFEGSQWRKKKVRRTKFSHQIIQLCLFCFKSNLPHFFFCLNCQQDLKFSCFLKRLVFISKDIKNLGGTTKKTTTIATDNKNTAFFFLVPIFVLFFTPFLMQIQVFRIVFLFLHALLYAFTYFEKKKRYLFRDFPFFRKTFLFFPFPKLLFSNGAFLTSQKFFCFQS